MGDGVRGTGNVGGGVARPVPRQLFEHGPGWPEAPPADPFGVRGKQPANLPARDRPHGAPNGQRVRSPIPSPRTPPPSAPQPAAPAPRANPDPAPEPVRRVGGPVLAVAVGLAEVAVAGYVGLRCASAAFGFPVRGAEAGLIARVVDRVSAGAGGGGGAGGLADRVLTTVLAGWVSITGGLGRHASAAAAVREAILAVTLLTVALLWALTHRLKLGPPARIAALVLVGGTPAAAALMAGAVRTGALAASCVALAAVLVAGRHTGTAARFTALGAVAASVLLAPVVAPAMLVTVAVLLAQRDAGAGWPRPVRLAAMVVAILAAAAGAIALVALSADMASDLVAGPVGALVDRPRTATPDVTPAEWILAAAVLALAAVAVRGQWLRAPAAGLVTLLATAVVVAPGARLEALTVAVPVAAVIAAGAADDLITRVRRRRGPTNRRVPRRPGRQRRAVAVAAALVTAALAAAGGVTAIHTYRRGEPLAPASASRQAAGWITGELPAGARLLVDDAVWPDLLRAGIPARRMITRSGIGGRADGTRPAWSVVAGATPRAAGEPGADQAGAPAVRYAAFGTGTAAVTIVGPAPAASGSAAGSPVDRRRQLGVALRANPRLRLLPPAAVALTSGEVDERLLLVLAQLAGLHQLEIAEFQVVSGEEPGNPPLRRLRITSVDGRPAGDAGSFDLVQHWLEQQLDPYRPASVTVDTSGVLVRYRLTEPAS